MMSSGIFFYSRPDEEGRRPMVTELGVHEEMPPGMIHGRSYDGEFIFLYFHTSATAEGETAAQGLLIADNRREHRYGNPDRAWNHTWLRARGPAVERLLALHQTPRNRVIAGCDGAMIERYWLLLYEEVRSGVEPDSYALEQILNLLLYDVARRVEGQRRTVPEPLRRAERLMIERLDQPLRLADAAAAAALSAPHFLALFKRHYGVSPMRFLTEKRMALAVSLLRRRELSIKEIALECGYADPLYFSRCFRRYFGTSPRSGRDCGGN